MRPNLSPKLHIFMTVFLTWTFLSTMDLCVTFFYWCTRVKKYIYILSFRQNQYCIWSVLKSIFFHFMQNAISAVLFCHVFSLSFQTATNASLPSLQNAIHLLNQLQRTIPCIVTSNGGALNTPGILVFLIYFVLCDQQTNKKIRAACDCHAYLVSKAGSVISSKSPAFRLLSDGATFNTQSRSSLTSYAISRS